jgi:hypothetical protein
MELVVTLIDTFMNSPDPKLYMLCTASCADIDNWMVLE